MGETHTASIGEEMTIRLHEAESQLSHLRRELEHAQRLATVGTLAAGIAHEINNLLTPILSYAVLARSHPGNPDLQEKAIEKTITGVESVTRLAQAILGFSAPAEKSQRADVQAAVDDAIACLARDPAKDGIQLSLHVQPGASVRMHPLSLQQVLLNLILNACRAMRPRGGSLKITAVNRGDGTTILTVSDTGPGVSREIIGRLFEPFVTERTDPKSARHDESGGGSGLGLAICKQLVEQAAGEITLSSSSKDGTTFTIVIHSATADQKKAV